MEICDTLCNPRSMQSDDSSSMKTITNSNVKPKQIFLRTCYIRMMKEGQWC